MKDPVLIPGQKLQQEQNTIQIGPSTHLRPASERLSIHGKSGARAVGNIIQQVQVCVNVPSWAKQTALVLVRSDVADYAYFL